MTGERVLLVEDNEKNMKLLRDVLTAKGYRVVEATSGEDAVARRALRRAAARADGCSAAGDRRG